MNKDQLLDKAFDEMLRVAASQAQKEIIDELSENMIEPEYSPEHNQKMKKIFREEKRKNFLRLCVKFSRSAAVVLLIAALVGAVCLFSVDAWRTKVMDLFTKQNTDHVEVEFNPSSGKDDNSTSLTVGNIRFGYVPEGFEVSTSEPVPNKTYVIFKDKNNTNSFFIFQQLSGSTHKGIDSEDGVIKYTVINGHEAILFVKNNGALTLSWSDEKYIFDIASENISDQDIIKIAENIKIIK